jgi:predicted nucleotide-binding protein
LDHLEKTIADLELAIKKRNLSKTEFCIRKLRDYSDLLRGLLNEDFVKDNFRDFERHMHFIEHFLKKREFEWMRSNLDDIKDRDFPEIKSKIYSLAEVGESSTKKSALSKKVFIVHGRDHEPMRELKTMLSGFGLSPIVLHEQASGSRTIVEKLEKYSNVGYAFVILTPDDLATHGSVLFDGHPDISTDSSEFVTVRANVPFKGRRVSARALGLSPRARQNVILEFGYFIGLLGRDRVCCLHRGNVELPSDMQGIVYIPFENSVEEIRFDVKKELQEAGYEIN